MGWKITISQVYRLFGKKNPWIEALDILHNRLLHKYINNSTNLINIVAFDIQKSIIIHDQRSAGLETSKIIDT